METNLFLLSARRKEYLANFQRLTIGYFSSIIYNLYDQVKKSNKNKKLLLKEFQSALASISTWNDDNKEFRDANAQLLEKLMNGIFKLDIVLRHELSKNAERHIPCLKDFMYQCLLNTARLVWKNPVLVYDVGVDKITYQQNKLKLEKLVMMTVKDTFTYYLPFDIDIVDDVVEETTKHEHMTSLEEEQIEVQGATFVEHEMQAQDEIESNDEHKDKIESYRDDASGDGDDDNTCELSEYEDGDGDGDDDDDDGGDDGDGDGDGDDARGTDTPDDQSDVSSGDSVLEDIIEEDDDKPEKPLNIDYIDDGNENEYNDDEPLTKQLDVDLHVSIPRYGDDESIVRDYSLQHHDREFKEVEQAIKNITIGEKPRTLNANRAEDDYRTVDGEAAVRKDIKVVNIDEKGNNGTTSLMDKVNKKNSLLAIKKKVKSQVFVEKKDQRRFVGTSFF
jgi:hypothetical protein